MRTLFMITGLHCSEKSATFSSEEEATSLNNVMTKMEFVHTEMYVT